jgi:hypothetical protein
MKKFSVVMISLLAMISLFGCTDNAKEEITKEHAEEIALKEFEKDLDQFNESSSEKIAMNDVELLSNDTHLSSSSKAWEVSFNWKDGLTKEGEATNSIAQYSISPEGKVKGKSTSFE